MHKADFIHNVRIDLHDDIIDIELLDKTGEIISKEKLSKGEQQLYATAILNALVEEYVDMISAGIVDPVKVTRSALQNATSVASTLLTTESVVANIKEDAPAMPAGGAGGMGMM